MNIEDTYKIILADDHPVYRNGLKNLIEEELSNEVVAEAENGEELLLKLKEHKCQLVVLDLSMPKMDGLKVLDHLKKKYPQLKILIMTMHKEREYFRKAVAKGVHGYILKSDYMSKIKSAILEIRSGRKCFSEELTSFIVDDYAVLLDSPISRDLLTSREKEIIKWIAAGLKSREIAQTLSISKKTVDNHRSHIMEKLKLKTAADLIKYAINSGLG